MITSECFCKAKFCMICNDAQHKGNSCLACQKYYVANSAFEGEYSVNCSCSKKISQRGVSYFWNCESYHFYCRVCGLGYNESIHSECIILYSGIPPYQILQLKNGS